MQLNPDLYVSDLAQQWRNGNCKDVINILKNEHPAMVALLFTEGGLQRHDINNITNRLIDDRVSLIQG